LGQKLVTKELVVAKRRKSPGLTDKPPRGSHTPDARALPPQKTGGLHVKQLKTPIISLSAPSKITRVMCSPSNHIQRLSTLPKTTEVQKEISARLFIRASCSIISKIQNLNFNLKKMQMSSGKSQKVASKKDCFWIRVA